MSNVTLKTIRMNLTKATNDKETAAGILLQELHKIMKAELDQHNVDIQNNIKPLSEEDRAICLFEHEHALRTLRMAIDAVTNAKAMFFGL